jgi:hypothetical protein
MNEPERTLLRFFTSTQRRAAEPGTLDQSLCHSARSILGKWNAAGADTEGTGTVVATVFCVVVSALHAAMTAMLAAASKQADRPRNEGSGSILIAADGDLSPSHGAMTVIPRFWRRRCRLARLAGAKGHGGSERHRRPPGEHRSADLAPTI